MAWLEKALAGLPPITPQDVQATLVELSARSIAEAIAHLPTPTAEVYVCGGGSHNTTLMRSLTRQLPNLPVQTTAALGLDPDWVEACAFAWLAHCTLENVPGNLPAVTGARRPVILGGIYKA